MGLTVIPDTTQHRDLRLTVTVESTLAQDLPTDLTEVRNAGEKTITTPTTDHEMIHEHSA
jgi:hypothetical protein